MQPHVLQLVDCKNPLYKEVKRAPVWACEMTVCPWDMDERAQVTSAILGTWPTNASATFP